MEVWKELKKEELFQEWGIKEDIVNQQLVNGKEKQKTQKKQYSYTIVKYVKNLTNLKRANALGK